MNKDDSNSENTYLSAFTGKFNGVLKWHQLDTVWDYIKETKNAGWYVYVIGEEIPTGPMQGSDLIKFIDNLDKLLRREHDEDYCGIVYANDLNTPDFVKVFDPSNLGTSCSIATKGPLPSWVLSKIAPVNIKEAMQPTANRRRWWQKIFK